MISSFINFRSTLKVSFTVFMTLVINTVCLAVWTVNFQRTGIVARLAYHQIPSIMPGTGALKKDLTTKYTYE